MVSLYAHLYAANTFCMCGKVHTLGALALSDDSTAMSSVRVHYYVRRSIPIQFNFFCSGVVVVAFFSFLCRIDPSNGITCAHIESVVEQKKLKKKIKKEIRGEKYCVLTDFVCLHTIGSECVPCVYV